MVFYRLNEPVFNLLNNICQLFRGRPFLREIFKDTALDFSVFMDIWMKQLGFESNMRTFKRKILKSELQLDFLPLIVRFLRPINLNYPQSGLFNSQNIISALCTSYQAMSLYFSLFNLASITCNKYKLQEKNDKHNQEAKIRLKVLAFLVKFLILDLAFLLKFLILDLIKIGDQKQSHVLPLIVINSYQIKMKSLTTILILALLIIFGNTSIASKYQQFKAYAHQYGKRYESKMVQYYRFAIYLKNMLEIERMNADPNDHALYGQTRFTDLTVSEARAIMGLIVPDFPTFNYVQNFTNDPEYKPKQTTPDIWDWVQQGVVGPIRDQGSCGSCWTFSTAGNIQSINFMANKDQKINTLSEQQLIDCDKSNAGCSGGWPYKAIDWLANNGGLMNDKDYPLRTNYSGPCQFNEKKERIKIKGYMNVTHDENIIKDALYETGPLSILLDFTGLMHYKSGVANPLLCSTWPDHALVLVGFGTKDHDYWLIKNSWGLKWGINGYFMLKRGANKCGINLWATTAVLDRN